MPVTNYTVIDGELVHENRAGVEHDYVPDPLGSTVALLNSSQTQTDTYTFWPYGEVRTSTGTTATPFQFVGTLGYYRDSAQRTYVRKRYLAMWAGRWLTRDLLWANADDLNPYSYVRNNPTVASDVFGLEPQNGFRQNMPGTLQAGRKHRRHHNLQECVEFVCLEEQQDYQERCRLMVHDCWKDVMCTADRIVCINLEADCYAALLQKLSNCLDRCAKAYGRGKRTIL